MIRWMGLGAAVLALIAGTANATPIPASAQQVGNVVTWNGQRFAIGAANTNNVVRAAGQKITLPAGSYSTLMFLATAVNGNQAGLSFVVTYTDGTTQTVTQSFSDWRTPQGYAGEAKVVNTAYRDLGNGTKQAGAFTVFGYRIALNRAKTVQSITLPNNANLNILAMNVV